MAEEVWKPVPSAPGWMASSHGRVCRPKSIVKMPRGGVKALEVLPTKGRLEKDSGRYRVCANMRTRYVAAMICEAFHGPKPVGMNDCMHLDEDKTNDIPSNLRWGTRKENMNAPKLKAAMSRRLLAKHPLAKLSSQQRRFIGTARINAKSLAHQFNITESYVYQLRAAARVQRV